MPQGTRTDREPSANLQKVTRPGAAALPHVSGRSMRSVKPGRAGPGERHAGAGAARGKRRGGCLGRGRGRSKASRRRRFGPQAWPRLDPSPPGAPIIHVSTWRRLADHHHHLAASMPPTDRGGGVVPPARAARPAAMGRRKPRRDPPARFVGGDRNSSVSPPPRAHKFLGKILRRPVTCREPPAAPDAWRANRPRQPHTSDATPASWPEPMEYSRLRWRRSQSGLRKRRPSASVTNRAGLGSGVPTSNSRPVVALTLYSPQVGQR
jgi:hypothetical protein